jgi:hypothetical protein
MNSWTEGIHKSSHILASESYCAFCAKPLKKGKNVYDHLEKHTKGK